MKLYIESCGPVESMENAFEAKADLANLLETVQDNDQALSPVEVAALHMTMKQIDSDFEPPAIEQYHLSHELYTTLALEDLKANIKGKWEAFLKVIKEIFKKIKESFAKAYQWFKSKFKRKAGQKNEYFERDEETEQEEVEEPTKPIVTSYTMKQHLIDLGDEASAESLIARLNFTKKLIGIVSGCCWSHGGIQGSAIKTAAELEHPETLIRLIQSNSQHVMEVLEEAGGEVRGYTMTLPISETVSIKMVLEDYTSFPVFELDREKEVTIEIPQDRKNYLSKLEEADKALLNTSMNFYKHGMDLAGDEVDISTVKDNESRQIIMKTAKLYAGRMKLTQVMMELIKGITTIADGIAADIRG